MEAEQGVLGDATGVQPGETPGMKRTRLARKTGLKRTKFSESADAKARRLWEKRLDDLARELICGKRDGWTCQRCGNRREDGKQIHWCHVLNRGAKSAQWSEWNSLALCAGCHFWFDGEERKAARENWWSVRWPERAIALAVWRHTKRHPPLDYAATEMYLKQKLAEHP